MKKIFYILIALFYVIQFSGCSKDDNPAAPDDSTGGDTEEGVWKDFKYPEVTFVNADSAGNGKYYSIYFDNPEEQIKKMTIAVCKIFYKNPGEVFNITDIEFRIEEYKNGVAATSGLGSESKKRIVFSSDYLSKLMSNRTKDDIIIEINGLLTHEVAHVYQEDCEYKNDGWSAIEGIADAVRYLTGNDKLSRRGTGGSWTDGYTTTGFFIAWLQEKKDPEYLYKMNQYVGNHFEFRWASASYSLLGVSVESLWDEYQADID